MTPSVRAQARGRGVLTSYRTADGKRRRVDDDVLRAVLDAMGPDDSVEPGLDPVCVAWDGRRPCLRIRLGRDRDPHLAGMRLEIRTELGDHIVVPVDAAGPPERDRDGVVVTPVDALPLGTHRVTLLGGSLDGATATILAAPRRLAPVTARHWGVFAPVSGLHDRVGGADLGCLGRFASWAASAGASVVGTLPLLATFLDVPYDPSPYAPVSRRWWNELYVDLGAAPELAGIAIPAVAGSHLDHRAVMAARRRVLECGPVRLTGARADALAGFEAARPEVHDYARFRALVEAHGPDRSRWPHGVGGVDPARERYHRYVQFLLDEQLRALSGRMRGRGQSLYLDLPVGTHPEGFDVACRPEAFAIGASIGAPPDRFFGHGQQWGFRPPHPERMRADGFADLRAALDRHLEVCDILRIDHVMGFERLWWIPDGGAATDGAYVRYPTDELFAVVCLAAHRSGARIVGEDLGTVSATTERSLARHRVRGMYVGQFAVDPDATPPLPPPPRRCVASLDTHDTATFAGFWTGHDVDDRVVAGSLDRTTARAELQDRARIRRALGPALLDTVPARDPGRDVRTQRTALLAWLGWLADGPAELVLVTLEDLWLELDPQNVPGTVDAQHRNWSRRLARPVDALADDPEVAAAVAVVRDRRGEDPVAC